MTLAWHFTGHTLRNGRQIPPIGEWLVHDGPIEICVSGLHASEDVWDALQYAPGSILHRVECDEVWQSGNDKLVCRRRKIIESHDVESLLRRFACDCALSVLPSDTPPKVREYLTSPEECNRAAAWDAAWDAARSAAKSAAWAAAWDAARSAARDAAWDAARDAMANDFRSRIHAQFNESQRSEG